MRRNRVDPIDGSLDARDMLEMQPQSSGRGQQHGRSLSVEREALDDVDGNDWLRTARTVRRARSLHRNAAHQNAINFLPSRHIGSMGAKMAGVEHIALLDGGQNMQGQEERVQHIVEQMEKDDMLMEDNPDAEELRIEALRDMAQCLTVKRNIKAKITASVSRKSKNRPIGCFKRFKYRMGFWWKNVKQNMRNLLFTLELWYESIKMIEGHFGSGVATYFRFLRWLFIMNIFISVFLISFLVIPQALYASHTNGTIQSAHFDFIDVFTGQGYFTNTTLYYGFYSNDTLSLVNGRQYNISYAYIFTMLFLYIGMFIALSISVARSYRRSFIETAGGLKNIYANKVFCGWDYGISSSHASALKSRTIYNEIRELLSDNIKTRVKRALSVKLALGFVKVGVHALVLILLVVTCLAMWLIMDETMAYVPEVVSTIRVSEYRTIFMALIVTAIMVVFPIIFSYVVRYEQYNNPRTRLFITLLRTFALEVVVVSMLCVFWLRSHNPCWETHLAQEVYRLIVFDFLFSVLGLPLFEYLRSVICKYLWSDLGMPEFDIARNTLGLIYNQTLLWMGLFYSPLLGAIVSIKMAILFYVKRTCIMRNCQPSSRSWRAAQTHTFFLVLIFMSLLAILLTLGYTFVSVPTGGCGPFKSYKYVYMVVVEGIFNIKQGNTFFSVIMYITKPGVVAFILIAMSVAAYYLRAKSLAQKGMVKILREMLVLGSKEKDYLLQAIAKVTDGDWVYSEKIKVDPQLETSNTWRYVKETDKIRKPSNSDYQFEVANSPVKKYSLDNTSRSSTPVLSRNEASTSAIGRGYDSPAKKYSVDSTSRSSTPTSPRNDPSTSGLNRSYDSPAKKYSVDNTSRSSTSVAQTNDASTPVVKGYDSPEVKKPRSTKVNRIPYYP